MPWCGPKKKKKEKKKKKNPKLLPEKEQNMLLQNMPLWHKDYFEKLQT